MVLLISGLMKSAFSGDVYNTSTLEAILEQENFAYSITYGNDTPIGELEVKVSRQGNTILTLSNLIIRNALARLFLDEYITENRFSIENGQLLLMEGEARRSDRSEIISSYVIDRENGIIQYPNQASISFPVDMEFDTLDFPFILLNSSIELLTGTNVLIVSHEKASLYQYETPQEEIIRLREKQYETLKVIRKKVGEEGRQVSVWLTSHTKPIPLKIVSSKKGTDLVFELLNLPR